MKIMAIVMWSYFNVRANLLTRNIQSSDGHWISHSGTKGYVEQYSETCNNRPSERRTTSVQRTNPMPPIAISIEITHLKLPRSGHLSTPNNGQPACLPRTATTK